MAFRKIYDGLRLIAKALGTSSRLGDIEAIETDPDEGYVDLHNGVSASKILTADHAATVTNKTISGTNNTLTDIDGDSLVNNSVDLVKLSKVGNNRVLYSDLDGDIGVLDQLTSQKVVVTDGNGLPTTATASNAEVDHLVGVTSGIQNQLDSKLPLAGGTLTGTLDLDDNSIINVPDPVSNQDAVNKRYVDAIAQGLDLKSSVRVATTIAGTLATSFENGQSVDGVTLVTGNRILIKNQSSQIENGIYVVQASGAPIRSADADTWTKLVGAFCFVEEGTTNGDTGWACNINSTGTLGVNDVTFVQFSAAGVAEAGAGLTKTGTTFSVNVDNSTTEISGNNVIVKAGGLTNTQISALAAIARSKLASGTASHVLINDGSGVMSSEATLAKSRGGSGQDNSSLTFPASGTLATLAGTEVFTNKDYDGGTASNSSRLTLPKNTKTNLDSLNRKEGTLVYATDQAKAFIDNGSSLIAVGSGSGGGGINYIENYDAEVNTDGWTSTRRTIVGDTNGTTEYFDTSTQANPYTFTENEPLISFNVNGLTAGTTYYAKSVAAAETQFSSTPGGSALNISTGLNSEVVSPNFRGFYLGSSVSTWTRSTSSPLRGDASFLLTKPASLAVGDVHYYAFTIDSADQGKMMQITFDYSVVSGTYATGDVIVRIRDVTNGTVIQPSGYQIENVGVASVSRMTFQTASNSTSYELIFNIASVSTSAYSLKFDNIQLGPQVVPLGAPVTDVRNYTPTLNSNTGVATNTARSWRIGDRIYGEGWIRFNGTGAAGSLSATMDATPSNMPGLAIEPIGTFSWYDDSGSAASRGGFLRYTSGTTVNFIRNDNSSILDSSALANNDVIYYTYSFKVAGWSSSTVVSSSADTRVVAAKMFRNASLTNVAPNNSSVKINLDATDFDTAGIANTGLNRLDVRVPGVYSITAQINVSGTNIITNGLYAARIFKNGSAIATGVSIYAPAGSGIFVTVSTTDRAVAGDYYELYLFGSGNNSVNQLTITSGSTVNTYCAVNLIQGPSQIAMSEIIACRAYLSASQTGVNTNNSQVKINFNATTLDTHGGWNTSTYRYTAPAPGIYEVATTIYTSSANVLANTYHPVIYVNGAEVQYGHPVPSIASTATGGYANWIGQLNAGDYVEIYWYGAGNNSASTMTIFGPSGTKNSSVHIKRLGGM